MASTAPAMCQRDTFRLVADPVRSPLRGGYQQQHCCCCIRQQIHALNDSPEALIAVDLVNVSLHLHND
eukprot:CAMPEP_0115183028 /NCGR_PEP_ID=MMETSP0270-20121206/8247_1 /TAXON_ID=71861 /ORGANISM="Scrippsiella trochoidea, Strain CCMP3099" /LENGTH=67 /DNA_ID=CAMNT_0002596093 /DNA_START=207 /DNA_END=411 /DNA_ORIENTATION=-